MRALVCSVIVIAVATTTAMADGFTWTAPKGCPTATDVTARITHRLEGDGDGSTDIPAIEVTVTRAGGFEASIDTRAITVANTTRTLRSARCDELADAVAVIVARLASEVRRERRAHAPIVEAVASNALAINAAVELPTPFAAVRVRPTAVTPENPKWGGGIRLLAESGIGIVPSVGIGSELAAFVRRQDAFAEIAYVHWAERPTFLVAGAPGRVDVGVQLAAIRGGWASRQMPLRAWLGIEVGMMSGRGIALVAAQDGSARWTALSSGFGVAWPISPHVRLVGTFEAAAVFERASFNLKDGSQIYQAAPASARCALGLEVGWR
ncbi:MAG: hypothetical protein ABI867_25200 [Kofleriaceae bacterium]